MVTRFAASWLEEEKNINWKTVLYAIVAILQKHATSATKNETKGRSRESEQLYSECASNLLLWLLLLYAISAVASGDGDGGNNDDAKKHVAHARTHNT